MWILLLLLLMGAGAVSAFVTMCACALAGRIDCEQALLDAGEAQCDEPLLGGALASLNTTGAPAPHPQLHFN